MLLVSFCLNEYSSLMGAHFNFTKPKLLVVSRIYSATWMNSFKGWEEILCSFWGPKHGHVHVSSSPWYTILFIYFRWGVGGTAKMFTVFIGHSGQKHLFIWFWRDWTWWARCPCSSSFYAALSWLHQWHKYAIIQSIVALFSHNNKGRKILSWSQLFSGCNLLKLCQITQDSISSLQQHIWPLLFHQGLVDGKFT